MATMGRYCKAYLLGDLKKYPGWPGTLTNLRPPSADGDEPAAPAERVLTDDDYFFVQENLQVTDGIFADEYVVFDAVNDAWQRFCADELKFDVPAMDTFAVEEDAVAPPATD